MFINNLTEILNILNDIDNFFEKYNINILLNKLQSLQIDKRYLYLKFKLKPTKSYFHITNSKSYTIIKVYFPLNKLGLDLLLFTFLII